MGVLGVYMTAEVRAFYNARARCTCKRAVSKRVKKQHQEGRFGLHWTKR